TCVRIWQLNRFDERLPVDIERADRPVAELAVPDLAPVLRHDQPVERGASGTAGGRRRGPDLGSPVARIEVADRVVADIGEPDTAVRVGQELVLVAETQVVDA